MYYRSPVLFVFVITCFQIVIAQVAELDLAAEAETELDADAEMAAAEEAKAQAAAHYGVEITKKPIDFATIVTTEDKICVWNCTLKRNATVAAAKTTGVIPITTTSYPYELDRLAQNDLKCKFQPYTYKCGDLPPERSYSYDLQQQKCVQTSYGHCKYAYNNFKTMDECKSTCRDVAHHPQPENVPAKVFCRFQPQFGNCNAYHPSFYFDINYATCIGFSFSGCGGNYNRFTNIAACNLKCESIITHIEQKS